MSLGDLAIAPSDTMQIWAGTGEEDSRNSISPGGGIYKSMDGGLTWELKGLEATEHIGRIVVHPHDPDIVWVAALGALWRSNPERGLYKTTDGGDSWQQSEIVESRDEDNVWVFWKATVVLRKPGTYTVNSRATDMHGNVQPEKDPSRDDGVNSWPSVTVKAVLLPEPSTLE